MKLLKILVIILLLMPGFGCQPEEKENLPADMEVARPATEKSSMPFAQMTRDELYDKVLGMLTGSAIGDAMGAPTEMWSRNSIRVEYGFVDTLTEVFREASPEGTWDLNLPAGGTTDDTRWKMLLGDYLIRQKGTFYQGDAPDPYVFSSFIVDRYQSEIAQLTATETFDPEPIEYRVRRMAWLQEWAVVAKPFAEKDLEGYSYALNRFYGGEVTCAGMLYSPMIGLAYPGEADKAYEAAYRLGLFDIGYARDITALTGALVAAAMAPDATQERVLNVLRTTDPEGYFKSRLVGRSSYRVYKETLYAIDEARQINADTVNPESLQLPFKGKDPAYIAQMEHVFRFLDSKNQDMPFHAGEIHQINLAALMFSDFDFQKALEFVVNYGRDNDTVAAITGAILGAYHGYHALPVKMKQTVLQTNRERLGIDLEKLAGELTDMMLEVGVVNLP